LSSSLLEQRERLIVSRKSWQQGEFRELGNIFIKR